MTDDGGPHPPEGEVSGLGRRALSSALILSLRKVFFQLILTGSGIVLARLLFPEIFGVFIILSFLVLIFMHLSDIGLSQALIQQREEPTIKQLRGVLTVHLLLGSTGALLLWFLAPVIISLYGSQLPESSMQSLRLLGLVLPLGAPGAVSRALLERHLSYKRFAVGELIELVVGKVVAILLAWLGLGVLALVLGELAMRLAGSIVFLFLRTWAVGLNTRFQDLSSLVSFGLPYQASSWVGLVNGAVVPFYIGNFPGPGGWSGAEAVGFITFASGVSAFTMFFAQIIGQLIFPVMARAQQDARRVRMTIERSLEMTALTSFGLAAVVFALSWEITEIVYTQKWLPAVPFLRLSLLQSVEIAVGLVLMNALLAFGASRIYLGIHAFWASLQWLLTVPLVGILGFTGLGWASLVVSGTGVVIPWLLLKKRIDFSFFSRLLPLSGIALVTLVAGLLFKRLILVENIWQLLVAGALTGLVYGAGVVVFLKEAVFTNFGYFWGLLRKRSE